MVLGTLGSRLLAARKAKKLTQVDLASILGVHPKTVGRWELDSQPPEESAVERIANALGVTGAWLRYGEGPSATTPTPPAFSDRARAFVNRFLAELAEAGVTEDEEAWARRLLMNPDNVGFNVGGNTPTMDEAAILRDIEGMSIGVRRILIARGHTNINPG